MNTWVRGLREFTSSKEWLFAAYCACIMANVAFNPLGQKQMMASGVLPSLVKGLQVLKRAGWNTEEGDSRKATLHMAACLQNVTYKFLSTRERSDKVLE